MRTFLRVLIIGLCSLILGIAFNQGIDQGIHWKTLLTANPRIAQSGADVFISPEKAYLYLVSDEAVFFDVRPFDEYRIDHIPGALSLGVATLVSNPEIISGIDLNRMIIVYGFEAGSDDAKILAQLIRRHGYPKTMQLEGGFAAWLDRGLPVHEGRMP